jgi:hypothetical protein
VRIVSPVVFIKEESNEKNESFCDKGGKIVSFYTLCHWTPLTTMTRT